MKPSRSGKVGSKTGRTRPVHPKGDGILDNLFTSKKGKEKKEIGPLEFTEEEKKSHDRVLDRTVRKIDGLIAEIDDAKQNMEGYIKQSEGQRRIPPALPALDKIRKTLTEMKVDVEGKKKEGK